MNYIVVPISAVQQSGPVTHIYTFFSSYHPPSWSLPRDWTQFPVLSSEMNESFFGGRGGLFMAIPGHMEVPGLVVESELQLSAYTTTHCNAGS